MICEMAIVLLVILVLLERLDYSYFFMINNAAIIVLKVLQNKTSNQIIKSTENTTVNSLSTTSELLAKVREGICTSSTLEEFNLAPNTCFSSYK